MAQTIYGAQFGTSPTKETNTDGGRVIAKNSTQFTANDIVGIDNTNGLEVATATQSVYGVVLTSQTVGASNQTVQMVKPLVFPVDQDYEWLMGTNSDLNAVTSVGQYYQIIGTTGIQQVDVSGGAVTGANRVVICTEVDPAGLGGTGVGSGLRQGLFKFVKVTNVKQNT